MTRLKLKSKITLGVLFLFGMLMIVSVLGFYYLNRVTREARVVLQDNYESLEYAKTMLRTLDATRIDTTTFLLALEKQEANITEQGERKATQQARKHFMEGNYALARQDLYTIMELNMAATVKKNERSKATADKALLYIALISGICFLLGITFVYNFPGYVANPIRELTEGIKGIAQKKYEQRLYFKSGDEFGELADAFNTMAQKLDEYEHSNLARILFEKKRAEAVIGSLKDATIGIDDKNTVLFANTEALQLLNIAESDIVGREANTVAKRNDLLHFLLHKNDQAPVKIVVNGKESFFTFEQMDIHHESAPIGHVIALKNITAFKELDQAKSHFIATISHELKTPLAATDLSLKLLEDNRTGDLNGEQQELLDSIRQDNRRMIRMVSDLLDFSRVESGNIQLQIQPVSPESILQYALDTVQKESSGRNIQIHVNKPETTPLLQADAEKSAWVLVNLLTNAIRYSTPGDAVTLDVSLTGKGTLQFSVQDHGKGIAPAYRSKVFERFFRVPGSEDSKGSGLGLAIAKEFIEAQGGAIGVESAPGEGSRFWFALPLHIV